ncbi:hypothetical protein [Pedobacter steynii]|uniref:T9SS C-terminal target domain-containing protein n=1 Tax=Pedobacter steynii TaxID=430522 RepID=A0A1D7QAX2_9SPHI|nr:hypothetical protein [Pedobacter steynii]AOM75832.1 hypothetical protein BFS30_00780 [Pedobacter steynii]
MKNVLLTGLALAALTFASSCKKDSNTNDNGFEKRSTVASYAAAAALPVQTVSGTITTNTTWDNTKVWELSGVVTVASGVTLTINPGTYIKSTVNTVGIPNGVLVAVRGAKINAIGTAENPIVFTSRNLLDNNAATNPVPGDFGGVILLGKAHVNTTTGTKEIEGLPTGGAYTFGSAKGSEVENDNSGTLKYVRIEYAGFNLSTDNEVNGLTLGGVGNLTTLDHIAVLYGKDDSFEFFGGTVNATYLVSKAADDDNFDFDNGYNGSIRYAVAVADKNSTHSQSGGSSDSNGIESDNNAPTEDATFALTPKTHPKLRNFSIIGTSATNAGYKFGVRNRRGAEIELSNSIITGYPSGFVFNDGTESFYASTVSKLTSNDFHGFTAAITPAGTYTGNTTSTAATAPSFSMSQPFFNNGTLSFVGATNGAFAVDATWAQGWSTL